MFKVFVRDKLICITLILVLVKSTGCVGVEERSQMDREKVIEVMK